jgi:hypothetical protein
VFGRRCGDRRRLGWGSGKEQRPNGASCHSPVLTAVLVRTEGHRLWSCVRRDDDIRSSFCQRLEEVQSLQENKERSVQGDAMRTNKREDGSFGTIMSTRLDVYHTG